MSSTSSLLNRAEKMHHYKLLMVLALIGICIVFTTLLVILYSRWDSQNPFFILPKSFGLSTVILTVQSFYLVQLVPLFKQERYDLLIARVRLLIVLQVAFSIIQWIGWYEWILESTSSPIQSTGVLMYCITVLHWLHVIAGFVYTCWMWKEVKKAMKDSVQELVWGRNPFTQLKWELLVLYWHFMDVLWISIFMIFFFLS